MYVTAHQVRRDGREEINAFLNNHGDQPAAEELRARIGSAPLPITVNVAAVGARFGAVLALAEDLPVLQSVCDRLSRSALAMLPHRNDAPPKVTGPYVVWASYGPDGVRLWLPPATLRRIP